VCAALEEMRGFLRRSCGSGLDGSCISLRHHFI
jgi:hypothetical protein